MDEDEEERQRWWLSVMQGAVEPHWQTDDSSSILERGRAAARRGGGSPATPSPRMKARVAELEAKFAELEASRYEPPELEELQVLCSTLESQKRSLEQEVAALRAQPVGASHVAEDLERQNAQLAGELSQSKEKSEQAQAVIRDLQEQLSYLMEELESEKVAHANLDATDFQDAAHQVNDLEHSARLADELSKSRAECLNLQEQLSRLQDEHAEITEHMAAGEVVHAALDLTDSSPGAAQKKVDDLEQKSTWLADELSQSKAAYHTALEQHKHDQAMIQGLEEQLNSLRDQHEQVTQNLSSEKEGSARLADQLSKSKAEFLESLEGRVYDQAAIQELSEQLTALQEEHALSQNQSDKVNDLEQKSAQLADELSKSKADCLNLQEQLSRLQDEHAEISENMVSEKVVHVVDLTDSSEAAQKKVDDLEQKSTWLADELSKSKAAYHTALEQRKHDQAMIQDLQEELSSLKSGTQVEEAPDKARIEELLSENRKLYQAVQEGLAQSLAQKALRHAEDELQQDKAPALANASPREDARLLSVDSPGIYVIAQTVFVTVGPEKASAKLQNLSMGTVVQVLEVVHRQDEKRVRGRIEEPAGWISIVSTEDGNRWAQRDLARSNRWAVNGQEQLQSLRRELELLEAASKDAEEAQRMQELQTARETAEAERAEEMDRRERELREMQDRLRKTELQLHSAQVAADGPGVYVLQSDVDLSEGCQRNSKKVGRLSAGQEVQVLEVVLREAERRVRGRLSGGWISLLDTAEGYRWAQKQLFATNEWIGQLTANAGLTEMKARCAGLEAQRDSLLEELNNASARPQGEPLAGSDESEELQALRGKVVLLEAGREEAELQAELLRTKYQTLEAELEEMQQDSSNHVDSAAARGLSLQAEELRRQLQQQVQERGKLEAELARLRAEELALHAEVEELRAATVSSPTAENPLTAAERWVLYTEVPKVEGTPSMTYFGKIKVDFDDEALGLGPLASVNFAQRAAASAAVERGDALRAALRHFREAGGETSLDPKALRDFLTKVFQEHGLTPPLEPHIKAVYDLFNPPPAEPRLDALHCLGLTDALLRAALRTKPKAESTTDPCCSCGELYEEDSNFCIACGEPRPSPVKKTVSWAPKVHLGPTMQKRACEGCQQPLTEDSTFCSMCGRVCGLSPAPSPPVKMVPQLAPYAPVAPLETLAPSRPLDATRIRGCRLAAEVQASSPGVCAFREVAAASLGTRPM